MNPVKATTQRLFLTVLLRALCLCAGGGYFAFAIPASAQQAGATDLQASHERLPTAEQSETQTDEMGIWVPVPVNHPARRFPATDEFPTGPAVGEPVPSFVLTDQSGQRVRFPEVLAGRKALVVFQRSAVW